jgi:hypothetical protein
LNETDDLQFATILPSAGKRTVETENEDDKLQVGHAFKNGSFMWVSSKKRGDTPLREKNLPRG